MQKILPCQKLTVILREVKSPLNGTFVKSNLSGHLRTHTGGSQTFATPVGKDFEKCLNKKDKRIHTGQNPYSFDTCGKTINQTSNIECSLEIYTGQKLVYRPFTHTN